MKIEDEEFMGCKLNSGQNLPHMRDVEDVKQLLAMLDAVW